MKIAPYGHIVAAAFRRHQLSAMLVWDVARAMGVGVSIDDLARELRGIFTPKYVRALLREGTGTFFFPTTDTKRVWCIGAARVAANLGAERRGMWRQEVDLTHLKSRRARQRALFAVTLPTGRPVSQAAIRELTGQSAATQRRLRGEVRVEPQHAVLKPLHAEAAKELVRTHASEGVFLRRGQVVKRLPNIHIVNAKRLRAGRRSRTMFSELPLTTKAATSTDEHGAITQKRYYRTFEQLRKANGGSGIIDDLRDQSYVRNEAGLWEAA